MCLFFFRDLRMDYLNDRQMEKKKVTIELEVLTSQWQDREIERDLDRLVLPLKNVESGQTRVTNIEIKAIR